MINDLDLWGCGVIGRVASPLGLVLSVLDVLNVLNGEYVPCAGRVVERVKRQECIVCITCIMCWECALC